MDVPPEGSEPRAAEVLALEYLQKRAEGAPQPLDPWLARLPDEAARGEFRALVAASERVERALPRAPRAIAAEQIIAGRYLLLRPLGVGGMGQVWEARDRQLDRHVAVKFLDSASQGRSDREDLFQRESRLLASLQHPGIVAVHEFGREGDLTYIVMDLVHGRSLSEVLDEVRSRFLAAGEQPLPRESRELVQAIHHPLQQGRIDLCTDGDWFRTVARIELELARTIEAAHGQRVVHRDLKPSNVMLTGGGNPVVLDFGLAGSSELSSGAVTRGLYGSVAYLAPEQAKNQSVGNDPRTDVYQLGLVLYEMLTLQRAFPGTAIGDVLERIQHGRFPAPRKVHQLVPRELQAICLRALELDPARRYASASELREDLERWLDGHELPRAVHAGSLRRAVRRATWHVRQRPWVSAAAGLLIAGGAGYAWWRMNPVEDIRITREQPLRYNVKTHEIVYFGEDDRVVRTDDYIGFRFRTNKPAYVWTLSVFGSGGKPDRVSPWNASTPEREGAAEDPFGIELPAGEHTVLGPRISGQPARIEGLVVLVADGPREYIERWFGQLRQREVEVGQALTWEMAKSLGPEAFAFTRELGSRGPRLSPEERERLRASFAQAPGPDGANWIELPGVRTLEVQCLAR